MQQARRERALPCLAQKQAPARPRMKREQTLGWVARRVTQLVVDKAYGYPL